MLGESDVPAGFTERAYPYQGVGEGWYYASLNGEVVTYLGNEKGCRGTRAYELDIGCPYGYFWCRGVGVDVRSRGGYVDVGRTCVGYDGLVMG